MAAKADLEVAAMQAAWKAVSELEPAEQKRVLVWLIDKLNLTGQVSVGGTKPAPATPASGALGQAGGGSGGQLTPKQFIAQKKPKTDAERITCLAYYLTHHRETATFKTKELTDLNKEAANPPFSNPGVAVSNAARDNYMAPAGGGAKQITTRGEALVDALPDREQVRVALEENPARKRKPRKGKSRKA